MADVTGPISSLPNSRHTVPEGTKCDEHPDRLAITRIQGETDSFGSEMHDLCQECLNKRNEEMKTLDQSGTCDWCRKLSPKLYDHRDIDEGSCGPVYRVCLECFQAERASFEQEMMEDWEEMMEDWGKRDLWE